MNKYILDFRGIWFADSDKRRMPELIMELREYEDMEYPCHIEMRKCKEDKQGIYTTWEEDIINNDDSYIYGIDEYEMQSYAFLATKDYEHTGKHIKEIVSLRDDIIDGSWLFSECWYAENSSWFPAVNSRIMEDMSYMYYNCARLEELDLSVYNTDEVRNMSHMFDTCAYLKVLDIRNFNMEKVRNTDCMLMNCINLYEIRLDNSDHDTIEKVINSSFFPHYEINMIGYESEIGNLIVKNNLDTLAQPVDGNIEIPEIYCIYHIADKDLELTNVTAERLIYCKRDNVVGLIPPGNWKFKFV